MKLYDNWKEILRRAWSIRLVVLAGALTGLELVIQYFGVDWIPIPTWARMLAIFALTNGAFIARLVAQKDLE